MQVDVCPGELEGRFVAGYDTGHALHLAMAAPMRQQGFTDTPASYVVSLDDALNFLRRQRPSAAANGMYTQLRGDNIIVADMPTVHMHGTLINKSRALKRSGVF